MTLPFQHFSALPSFIDINYVYNTYLQTNKLYEKQFVIFILDRTNNLTKINSI